MSARGADGTAPAVGAKSPRVAWDREAMTDRLKGRASQALEEQKLKLEQQARDAIERQKLAAADSLRRVLDRHTKSLSDSLKRESGGLLKNFFGGGKTDTTAVRGSHRKILDAFKGEGAAMLVGTQIIAKGHDFPDVHVAVVVSADHGLRMPDFRASERTYALLVQAAGRAGRGDVAGRVFLQTWKPDHPVLQRLSDIEGFFADELRIRATLRYPPFSRLVLVRLEGAERGKVAAAAGDSSVSLPGGR